MPNDATSSDDPKTHDPTHVGAAPKEPAAREADTGERAAPKSDDMSEADTANGEGPGPDVTPSR